MISSHGSQDGSFVEAFSLPLTQNSGQRYFPPASISNNGQTVSVAIGAPTSFTIYMLCYCMSSLAGPGGCGVSLSSFSTKVGVLHIRGTSVASGSWSCVQGDGQCAMTLQGTLFSNADGLLLVKAGAGVQCGGAVDVTQEHSIFLS